jgi:hypothetical protein
MKKALTLAAVIAASGAASAAPFVFPQAWSATPAAEARTGGIIRYRASARSPRSTRSTPG